MASLTGQALVVSAARLFNQGLMIISPLILVRLLTVEDFGLYREFLLYATIVGNLAAFSLPNSLLYFIGREPAAAATFVNRVVLGVAVTSLLACCGFVVLSFLLPEPLLDGRLLLCVAYVLFLTNVDFWEFLWFAQKRPLAVFAYSSGRLAVRLIVVVSVAWLSRDIDHMLMALVLVEAGRLALSLVFWRRMAADQVASPARAGWREMLEFCVPSGLAVFVTAFSSSLSGMFVDQALGTAALAHFVIGGYVFLTIFALRNAVSDVLLPEMVARGESEPNGWLPVWKRSVVVLAVLLLPFSIALARYAEEFIRRVFSDKYLAAEPIFLAYCVLIALSCFDIALVYRAANRTRAMLVATFVTVGVNLAGLVVLVPQMGMTGAAIALVVSTLAAMTFAIWQLCGKLSVSVYDFLPLTELSKVAWAALVASTLLFVGGLDAAADLLEISLTTTAFLVVYALLLRVMGVEGASWMFAVLRRKLSWTS
jgi:O-antigen/teichoic acid export membrane protein